VELSNDCRVIAGFDRADFPLVADAPYLERLSISFVRVGPLIGPQDADRLRAAMLVVFAEIEPKPDPDRIVDFSRPTPAGYSERLREGLARRRVVRIEATIPPTRSTVCNLATSARHAASREANHA
jgi:hypothetical protein